MQRYGYLEEGDGESDALYSEEGISEAIKTLQRFGNIPQTGVIDNSTLEVGIVVFSNQLEYSKSNDYCIRVDQYSLY